MRLVKLGLLSPPGQRRGLTAATARDSGRHRLAQYMCDLTARTNSRSAADTFYTYWVPGWIRSGQDPDMPQADRCHPTAAQLDGHAAAIAAGRLQQRLDALGARRGLTRSEAQHATADRGRRRIAPVDPVVAGPARELGPRQLVQDRFVVGSEPAEAADAFRGSGADRLEQRQQLVADPIPQEGRIVV